LSLAGSVRWARLHAVDGVDLMYAGSAGVRQSGHEVDLRLGLLKEWAGKRSFEALLLHDRYGMTQDVTYLDQVWDPGTQQVIQRPRVEPNLDRTNTWGLHFGYEQPLGGAGWRIGGIVTANRMSHPKIPNYAITNIPRDPGYSTAFNVGVGLSRKDGPATFGIDAIYEPIWSSTWADAAEPIVNRLGVPIPTGAKTIDNRFRFSNVLYRLGIGREVSRVTSWQIGLEARSIHYRLTQHDNVQLTLRQQEEWWNEWTPTWGLTLRFPEVDLRYAGRVTYGTGRPGVARGDVILANPAASNILAAPSGPLTLDKVSVVMHQISISVPIR